MELRERKKPTREKTNEKKNPKTNKQAQTNKKKGIWNFEIYFFFFFFIDRMGIFLIRIIKTLIIFPQKKFAVWKHFGQLYQRLKY